MKRNEQQAVAMTRQNYPPGTRLELISMDDPQAILWLRYGTVKKLMAVQEELKQQGLYLKVWDGFRPPAAQWKLWDVCPDPNYVSNPNNGFSSHSRGNTVDITLVYADGTEVKMPTGFDDFSKLADRDYSDCDAEAAANALMLEQIMIEHGFNGEQELVFYVEMLPAGWTVVPMDTEGTAVTATELTYVSGEVNYLTTGREVTDDPRERVACSCTCSGSGDQIRYQRRHLSGTGLRQAPLQGR